MMKNTKPHLYSLLCLIVNPLSIFLNKMNYKEHEMYLIHALLVIFVFFYAPNICTSGTQKPARDREVNTNEVGTWQNRHAMPHPKGATATHLRDGMGESRHCTVTWSIFQEMLRSGSLCKIS